MTQHDRDMASARADLCRFLSACYYEPGPEFTEERLFDSMLDVASRVHPDLAGHARRLREAYAAEDTQTLLIDYTRLFLGPIHPRARPYGSFWLSGETTLMQPSSVEVLALYEQGGFAIDEEFRELPDHVAVELEFLYLLIFGQIQARREGAADELASMTALAQRFLAEHLGAWVGPFTKAVSAGAETAFYRELGAFTDRFVRMEAANLASH